MVASLLEEENQQLRVGEKWQTGDFVANSLPHVSSTYHLTSYLYSRRFYPSLCFFFFCVPVALCAEDEN